MTAFLGHDESLLGTRADPRSFREVTKVERDETRTESLLEDASEAISSIDELREKCLPTLTARIWETCCWPERMADGWKVGDYNFIIVEYQPAGDDRAALYVQLWSEPLEPAVVEVCSGNWNPGAVKYIRDRERQALEGLGFKIGGRAGNFRKEVAIRSAAEAERVASEALSIIFDVFQYRGGVPLRIKCHQGERAEHAAVHHSLTPEDFIKLALEGGFRAAQLPQEHDTPVITLARGDFRSLALLRSRVPRSRLFTSVLLRAVVRSSGRRSQSQMGRIQELAPVKVVKDQDGTVWAQTELTLAGGVAAPWIIQGLKRWRSVVRECGRAISVTGKRRTAQRAPHSTSPVRES